MMCETVERYVKEVTKKASKNHAKNMFLDGLEFEKVKKYIPNLTEQELHVIQGNAKEQLQNS